MAAKAVSRAGLSALRETIARIENEKLPGLTRSARGVDEAGFQRRENNREAPGKKVLSIGVEVLDGILDGGIPLEGLTEIRAPQTRDAGAASGFALAIAALCQGEVSAELRLPVLWIGQAMGAKEAGLPYAVGLQAHGLDMHRFLLGRPRTVQDALWIVEAALIAPVFAAIILEVRGNPACLGLSESRRLHVRARAGGTPLLLLRQSGEEEASSALFRLRVESRPGRGCLLPDGTVVPGSIGNPVFYVTVEKSRMLSHAGTVLEWSSHDRRFYPLGPDAAALQPDPAHPVAQLPAFAVGQGGAPALGHVVAFKRAS
jgi:protein ImuA